MPTHLLKLRPQETERLRLSWHCSWKKLTVYWDSQRIATFYQSEPIEDWQSVVLPTGDVLTMRFMVSLGRNTLEVMCNKQILARVDVCSPYHILDEAFGYMLGIAGGHFLVILAVLMGFVFTQDIWLWILLLGVVYVGLDLLQKRNKLMALVIASVLYVVESSYLVYDVYKNVIDGIVGSMYLVPLLLYILALYHAVQGLQVLVSPKCD